MEHTRVSLGRKSLPAEKSKGWTLNDHAICGKTDVRAASKLIQFAPVLILSNFSGSSEQATQRLDSLINRIRDIQYPYMHGVKPVDIILVAHHILRAFAKRWLRVPIGSPLTMMLPPRGIGVLRYVSC